MIWRKQLVKSKRGEDLQSLLS
uniref:Uncharacterized protein n=1 Tax=Lepeophtheirus salmonis TaxID=72036 RepID=A0A0K2US67_LEPSM